MNNQSLLNKILGLPTIVLVAAFALCASQARAAILISTDEQGSAYTPSNGDLLQTAYGSFIGGTEADTSAASKEFYLHNGNIPAVINEGTQRFTAGNHYVEWEFDLATNAGGYDITGIDSYEGWDDRNAQRYEVSISFVDAPTTFSSLVADPGASGFTIAGTNNTWNQVQIVNNGGGVLDNGSISATGVARIRFDFDVVSGENGVQMYREIDVFGAATVPEPSSIALMGLAVGCLLTFIRRR